MTKILLTNQPIHYYYYYYLDSVCKKEFWCLPSGTFFDRIVNLSEARSTDVISYLWYDYHLQHILWISRILVVWPAMQIIRPLFYHTYDLLLRIATQDLTWTWLLLDLISVWYT